ncbi:MAG: oligosaccharide flippase family protein, partial [Candidatus Eisenbacteria bacterium]|nr:oligosaccharide flippase family protein [Candidatus Eisenbacteria bacterium]
MTRIVRHTLALAAGQYVARAVLLARGLAAAAALGPVGAGAWNALSLILDYGGYASAGALQGLELELPGAVTRDPAAARRAMRGAWAIVVAGALAFGVGIALWLASGARALESTWGAGAPALMLIAAWLQLVVGYLQTSLKAQGDFARVSFSTALQALVGGGLGLALVWRLGVWALLGGWLAGSLAAIAILIRSPHRVSLSPGSPREGLRLARLGLPVFGFFVVSLILRSLDRMAFVRYVGLASLGAYSLGLLAAGLVLYLPEAAAAVLYPRIAAAASGDRDALRTRDEVVRAQRTLAVFLPLAVGLSVLWIGPVIGWLLPAFAAGVPAMRAIVLGALALSAGTLPGYWLLARGQAPRLLVGSAGVLVLTAGLIFAVAASTADPMRVALASAGGYA